MKIRHFLAKGSFLFFLLALPMPGLSASYQPPRTEVTFEKWRESIPDYEKRLYDRVKSINHRTVVLTNIMIGGFLILLIAGAIMTVRITGHISDLQAGVPIQNIPQVTQAPEPPQPPAVDEPPDDEIVEKEPEKRPYIKVLMDQWRSKKILRNQVKFGRALIDLQAFAEINKKQQENLGDILSQTKDHLGALTADIEEIQKEPHDEPPEDEIVEKEPEKRPFVAGLMEKWRSQKNLRTQEQVRNALRGLQAYAEVNSRQQENLEDILGQTKDRLDSLAADIKEVQKGSHDKPAKG